MIRIHFMKNFNLYNFHKQSAAQLNDTRPALGVADLIQLVISGYPLL